MAQWRCNDLFKVAGHPSAVPAAGIPFAYGVPVCSEPSWGSLDTSGCPILVGRVVFRGIDNNIHELALVNGEWELNNLTQVATADTHFRLTPGSHAPTAWFDPTAFAWVDENGDGVATVIYQGSDNCVHSLSLFGSWMWDNLSTSDNQTPPPPEAAVGTPFGYTTGDGTLRVVYRGPTNDIYELSGGKALVWNFSDLSTNNKGAPPAHAAAGNPCAYFFKVPRVIYRGTDGHIYELAADSVWECADLTEISGAPLAAGDPFGYVWNNVARVIYTDTNQQIIELALLERWTGNNLSTNNKSQKPAHAAAGNPFAYVTFDNIPRVIYRGTDSHIYEIHPDPFWSWADLSQISSAEPAAGDPFGYVIGDSVPRVVYRGANSHIMELAFF